MEQHPLEWYIDRPLAELSLRNQDLSAIVRDVKAEQKKINRAYSIKVANAKASDVYNELDDEGKEAIRQLLGVEGIESKERFGIIGKLFGR